MTRASLAAFFDPRSVAVIGASRDPSKVGGSDPLVAGPAGAVAVDARGALEQ